VAVAAGAVFALLVVATVGAFFVTQRLKRSKPVVRAISLPLYVSPNGDGRKDRVPISFVLPKPDNVTVSMVNGGGDEVRRLVDDRHLGRGRHAYQWDGRDGTGAVPPAGTYYLRVTLRGQGRATTAPRGIQLVTAPPRPRLVSVTPSRLPAGGTRGVTIRFAGPSNPVPVFTVFRTTGTARPRVVDRFNGTLGSTTGHWSGRDASGRRVPPGNYAIAVTVQNRALVAGSAPRRLPPSAATATQHTGVTVSGPEAAAPAEPVRAGGVARVTLTGMRGRTSYRLFRAGATRPLRRGRSHGAVLRVGIPRRAASGLYTVRVRGAAGSAAVPLVVRRAQGAQPVLVVLPTMTWQGSNPVDADADGFGDTLAAGADVSLARPYAFGRLPAALRSESAPLLAALGGSRHYDVTTDLALALGHGPGLAGHRGVIFAGSETWLSTALEARLRAYVNGGGKLASFGTDAFRRTVRVNAQTLAGASPPQRANAFGEQTAPARSEAAPLVVERDALGLFASSDGFVGLFTRFEQQRALAAGTEMQTAAGRDPAHPSFVAYKLGRGTVIRVGTPQWSLALADDPEVKGATEAIWALLSR
jgi:hypothetical protein